MAGVCAACGEVKQQLYSCDACGSHVCSDCKKEYGCKVCSGGVKKMR